MYKIVELNTKPAEWVIYEISQIYEDVEKWRLMQTFDSEKEAYDWMRHNFD